MPLPERFRPASGLPEGIRLATSWLTVLPVRGPADVNRDAGGRAITATPVVGAGLGAVAALVAWLGTAAALPAVLVGLLTVAAHALLTRGMHIDGLSDTIDGLGCYGPPERAQAVMKSGGAGPFGVAALVITLGAQGVAIGELANRGWCATIVIAMFTGRVAVVGACRVGGHAASPDGFGALVAGTQRIGVIASWTVASVAVAVFAVPGRWWQGPIAVALALVLASLFAAHCVKRFGGLPGDVLGACIEVTTTVVLVACLIG
ncbi:adenosylcobinamide-GDP ribazoletransferase [Rhodococcoides trifolii]|uniref:Adenosylcobinamide-GDP ribazoletransferase n=1 Tax=Rhodococcoides trifolii TaxID=908250 RepID=A0A917D314_9NOCA|nr:adenosylcobinamide-GDP ribazoletransferase [Rhodococcus trifolii]GGG05084.1 adenosylcobinamide-GDP ribazoletransferase [Rhodococcus trifolii]